MFLFPKSKRGFTGPVKAEVDTYRNRYLWPAEEVIFTALGDSLKSARVLDIGVGAGRTAWNLIPKVADYTAIDFSPAMIDVCKEEFEESDRVRFLNGDARDLSRFSDDEFDLVLFSFNGLDYIKYEERTQVLAEVRRVLKTEGDFVFSGHSLRAYPLRQVHPRRLRGVLYPLGVAFVHFREIWMRRVINRDIDPAKARAQGWAEVIDFSTYPSLYLMPELQLADLDRAGFRTEGVFDLEGHKFSVNDNPSDDWMLHYWCKINQRHGAADQLPCNP